MRCARRSDDRARPGKIDLTKFHDLGLAEPVLKAVLAEGYETPTPIQAKSIPVMLAGHDVLGIAQTGTGKTAAFVLPQLDRLARGRTRPSARSATVLILAPTRELAAQIAAAIRTYGKRLSPSVAIVIGGTKPGPQVRALARGVDFLVATPGRLLDHMASGAVSLKDVNTVILDEADQMFDLGFMPAIRRIMGKLPANRQTLLFSATMPRQIRDLADTFLTDPVEVAVTPAATPIERIDQKVVFVDKAAKLDLLASLLKDGTVGRAVVFTRTKHGADRLSKQLGRAGIEAQPIHGDRSQYQRERTLAAFRDGSLSILVATDIAARGIDIDDVSHVFNYELPHVPEVYVHRIGRTARAGRNGVAIAFCDASERSLLRDIGRLVGRRIPVLDMAVSQPTGDSPDSRAAPSPAQDKRRGEKTRGNRKRGRRGKNANCPDVVSAGPQGARAEPGERTRRRSRRAKPANSNRPQTAHRADTANHAPQHQRSGPAPFEDAEGLARMLGNIGSGFGPGDRTTDLSASGIGS